MASLGATRRFTCSGYLPLGIIPQGPPITQRITFLDEIYTKLKVFTLNCWGIGYVPYLRSPNRKERIAALAEFLAQNSDGYDLVCLQEVWVGGDRKRIYQTCSEEFPFHQEFHGGVIGTGLLVLSRFPLVDVDFHRFSLNGFIHHFWCGDGACAKGIGMVTIKPKGDLAVNLYVSHYHAEYNREDDIFLADRVAQASEALNFIRRCSATSGAVVDIYAGDFNSERGDLPYRLLMILGGFTEEGGDTPTYAARTSSYGLEKLRPQVLDYVMHRASQEGWATTTARVWRPLPQRVPGNEFSYSDHEAVATEIAISRHSDSSTHPTRARLQEQSSVLEEVLSTIAKEATVTKRYQSLLAAVAFAIAATALIHTESGVLGFALGAIFTLVMALTLVLYQERKNTLDWTLERLRFNLRQVTEQSLRRNSNQEMEGEGGAQT